jgi:hypothetical protein
MRCSKYCTSVAADSDASPRLSDDRRLLDDVVSGHIDSSPVGLNRRYPPPAAAMTKNQPLPMFLDVVLHKKSIGAISGGS